MSLQPQFSLINSEFNAFLYAAIGEEKTGVELTVLSALSRLGIDPWAEAARLSDLPKEAAARTLTAAIAALPGGRWKVSDLSAIAARLVDRLPRRSAPAVQSPQRKSRIALQATPTTAAWLICLALVVALSFFMMHRHANEAPPPNSTSISSMHR